MVNIKALTYEEARLQYFIEQKDAAERRIKYWESRARAGEYNSRAHNNASEAGAEWNYLTDVVMLLSGGAKEGKQ